MKSVNNIILSLRKKKVKITAQRLAIIEFLEKNPIHPAAEDIYRAIKNKFPTISLATIYNTLEMLEEIGEVVKLKLSNSNRINYEYNLNPHHHFFCNNCKKIYDIYKEVSEQVKEIEGHYIENIQILYSGICKNCGYDKTGQKG